ncbi:CubicO group peptidase (beta-lactamase class C family) [Algoriphagus sp. 4150]|uniref:serine hydrolase domain-containing protein n=1 Tax=Algoriphagus sp. 4150 TaxID=2817756 RepID=UPI0028679BEC|nr:serine hydrolase domain-containing protein [Algoriphagus sp. 4150]MDR7131896.1 CubicO group peptidase (beta-lactamase class C family) [Algoriphagus sp. 4150]
MNKKIKIILPILIFWIAIFLAWEWWYSYPKVRTIPVQEVQSESEGIDSIIQQAISTHILPGISVAIVRNDTVFYLRAFGYENLQTKNLLTVDSKILVASVSKLFSALGAASILHDRGIDANDSLHALRLGEKFNSSSLATIRFQDLLSHQSGIRDKKFSELILSSPKSQSLNKWGEEFLQNSSNFFTDSISYAYADSNYDLLGFILSQSEKLDFDSLIHRKIFMGSGMTNSNYLPHGTKDEYGVEGYQKTFIWKRIMPKQIKFPVLPSPSSGLATTTRDMSLAMIHLLRGDKGAYHHALDWLTIEGSKVPVGFQKMPISGSEWIGHYGGQGGYSSLLFYSKEAETGIFLFSNTKDKEDFRLKIATQIISYVSLNDL